MLGLRWLLDEPRAFPRWRERYGDVFMLHSTGFAPPLAVVADQTVAKEIFGGDTATLRAGDANGGPLSKLVGPRSLLVLDEEDHLRRRKLMLPPFHGERMRVYQDLIAEIADAEIDRWPLGRPFALYPSMQTITLRVILRAVFGIEPNERRLSALEDLFVRYANRGMRPWALLMARRELSRYGPWRGFLRTREEVDSFLFAEIDRRRRQSGIRQRQDVLSMLLEARDEDGATLSTGELRDQLLTLLIAGHETTATALAWTFERLLRSPRALRRLTSSLPTAAGDQYLGWVVEESLRVRPVVPFAFRFAAGPTPLGPYTVPAESLIAVSISLIHQSAGLYPDPTAFRPERFEGGGRTSFSWLPFGGGVRRCLGASFALFEMKVALRRIVERCELQAVDPRPERPRRRAVTFAPQRGTQVVLKRRAPAPSTDHDEVMEVV